MTLTTTKLGAFSGTLSLGTVKQSFKGELSILPDADPTGEVTVTRKDLPNLDISFTLLRASRRLTGEIKSDGVTLPLDARLPASVPAPLANGYTFAMKLAAGDIGDESFCRKLIADTLAKFGKLDIVVNNAAEQHSASTIEDISSEQFERTFRTNIFAYFYLTKAAMPHLKEGACIVNTTSVTAYRGSSHLLDYSSTKGAIVSFTRSLSQQLAQRGIRVNAVAPGPVWTPLIPSSSTAQGVTHFGQGVPLGRAGQPDEIAPCFVFLASDDSSYMTGQVLHPNGGEIVNT